jgi:hypothetical protein
LEHAAGPHRAIVSMDALTPRLRGNTLDDFAGAEAGFTDAG